MNQNVWGKCAWVLIHSIAVNYPDHPSPSEKENTIKFFSILGDVLPCRFCRQHYRENLKYLPNNYGIIELNAVYSPNDTFQLLRDIQLILVEEDPRCPL